MRAMSGARVATADKLFATLDPVTRRVSLPGGDVVLLSDTVGFIQKLPTELVAAFRATLEELNEAHLLLHMVDASHPHAAEQAEVVVQTLATIGAADRRRLLVLNKVDRIFDSAAPSETQLREFAAQMRELDAGSEAAVATSATRGWGLDTLLETIEERLSPARSGTAW
jgi:GTP-binding protein HflX